MVAFHRCLNREWRTQSPPFALCAHAGHANCLWPSRASRTQRCTKVCSTIL